CAVSRPESNDLGVSFSPTLQLSNSSTECWAMELGVLLIPLLILLSGAIALVGNAVGRNIGRRRLSLVGLRPRYTAQIVTVVTGMLITIVTLIVVLLISSEARVALFRLNAVLRQTRQLEEEIHRQEDRLKQLALGDIAYLSNQEVLRDVIDGRQPEAAVRQRVLADVERATEIARSEEHTSELQSPDHLVC